MIHTCLSVRQPWAWLIVHGYKDVENRNWSTNYHGPVLIHAAKGCTADEWEACWLFVAGFSPDLAARIPRPAYIERGGIIGQATITGCVFSHSSPWFCGPYGFVLTGARPLPFIACKGALGFFKREMEVPSSPDA